mgnify:CR=1 FL=1
MSYDFKFYGTLVTILGGGAFTRLIIQRCVPTLRKLSSILNIMHMNASPNCLKDACMVQSKASPRVYGTRQWRIRRDNDDISYANVMRQDEIERNDSHWEHWWYMPNVLQPSHLASDCNLLQSTTVLRNKELGTLDVSSLIPRK